MNDGNLNETYNMKSSYNGLLTQVSIAHLISHLHIMTVPALLPLLPGHMQVSFVELVLCRLGPCGTSGLVCDVPQRIATGQALTFTEQAIHSQTVATTRSQLSENRWAAAWLSGQAQSLEEAVQQAISSFQPVTAQPGEIERDDADTR